MPALAIAGSMPIAKYLRRLKCVLQVVEYASTPVRDTHCCVSPLPSAADAPELLPTCARLGFHGGFVSGSPADHSAQLRPSSPRRQDGRFRRLGHAGPVFRHHRRASRRPQRPSDSSMSATWARSKSAGRRRSKLIDYVTTNAVPKLKIGQAHYSGLLYEHGGFVDDILVHKVADDHFFICVNASNQEKDFEHISAAQPLRRRRSNSPATATRKSPSRARTRSTPCRS